MKDEAELLYLGDNELVYVQIPLDQLALRLPKQALVDIGLLHNIPISMWHNRDLMCRLIKSHVPCNKCEIHVCINAPRDKSSFIHKPYIVAQLGKRVRVQPMLQKDKPLSKPNIHEIHPNEPFPSILQTDNEKIKVIHSIINDTLPPEYHEAGCAICGCLQSLKELEPLDGCAYDLSI